MTVDLYTLGDIRRRIRSEFNIGDDPAEREFLTEQINKAHLHIARQRGRWHWQLKEASIDIPEKEEISVTATKGSRSLTLQSGTLPSKRAVLISGSSDYGTQGYVVVSTSGTTITLNRQWLGSSATLTMYVHTGYVALPDDFYAVNTADELSNIAGESLKFFDTQRFQHIRNSNQMSVATDRIYTIMGDPINEQRSRRYMAFYPTYGDMDTLFYSYYYVPARLVDDSDEPILPVGDRPVLVDLSLWFVAQSKGYDKVLLYRDMALGGINDMLRHSNENASYDFDDTNSLNLDMSATRDHNFVVDSDYSPHIV